MRMNAHLLIDIGIVLVTVGYVGLCAACLLL